MRRGASSSSAPIGVLVLLLAGSLSVWGKQDVSTRATTATAASLTHGPLVGDVRPDHVQVWLQAQASGSTLKLLVNGVEKLSVTDVTFGSGPVGILLGSNLADACRADNFAASAP